MDWLAANSGSIFFLLFFVLMMRMHTSARAAEKDPRGEAGGPSSSDAVKELADGVHVRVKGAFYPARVVALAGAPVRIIFRREETNSCSERVVFPDYQWVADLPPFQETVVELPPRGPGEHEFSCAEGRLQGTLVLTPSGDPVSAGGSAAIPPLLAGALSFFIPGLGHLFIRAWFRGIVWLAGWLVVTAASGVAHGPAVLILMAIAAVDAYVIARSAPSSSNEETRP